MVFAILSFVIVGFLNLFVYGTTYIGMARNRSTSSVEAQSKANIIISDNTTGYPRIPMIIYPTSTTEVTINVTVSEIFIEETVRNTSNQMITIKAIKTDE